MAILQTRFKLEENGWELVRTISDRGMMIRQDETGEIYAEAVDPVFTGRTYTETDIPIAEENTDARNIVDGLEAGFSKWDDVSDIERGDVRIILEQDVKDGKISESRYEEIVGVPYGL